MADTEKEVRSLPAWLAQVEQYTPPRNREQFLQKNILKLLAKLAVFRKQYRNEVPPFWGISFLLLYEFFVILLISLSHRAIFPAAVLAFLFIYLCQQDGEAIIDSLKAPFGVAIFTGLIMLPAFFYQGTSVLLLPFKVFVTVLGVVLLARRVPFYRITRALGQLHLPSLFILVFDLTVHYIALLGRTALELLTALQLRSLGRNKFKYRSLGGILGVTFLKAQEYGQETYESMVCRGFVGEYHRKSTRPFGKRQVIETIIFILTLVAFFFLEGC